MWLFYSLLILQIASPTITPLSFEAEPFIQAFNSSKSRPRIVGIFSPTCGHCLQACSDLQSILTDNPNSEIKVLLLWAPFGENDNLGAVRRAVEVYVDDRRISHFWDMWRFGSRSYSDPLRIPVNDAWGLFLFFEPEIEWVESAPKPEFWMQNRNLRVGTPFSKKGMERKLKKWLD